MIKFFKKNRFRSLFKNRFRKYLVYAIGEILLVVIGILIAVQINKFNDQRKNKLSEQEILKSLSIEFTKNQEALEQMRFNHLQQAKVIRDLLNKITLDSVTVPKDTINMYMANLIWTPQYNPDKSVLSSTINSGKISFLKNEKLKYKLTSWFGRIDEYNFGASGVISIVNKYVNPYIHEHFQIRDIQIKVALEEVDPSNFSYDQHKLLSDPRFENIVEHRRLNSEGVYANANRLFELQSEIIELLENEINMRFKD